MVEEKEVTEIKAASIAVTEEVRDYYNREKEQFDITSNDFLILLLNNYDKAKITALLDEQKKIKEKIYIIPKN